MPSPAITDDVLCPACGYMLRGLTEYRCPECGRPFDPAKLAPDPIPWTQRRWIGWIRAYVQTVMWSTFRVRRLSEQVRQPVSYRDAQLFRWVTIIVAFASSSFMILVCFPLSGIGLLPHIQVSRPSTTDPWTTMSMFVATMMTMMAATSLPSYFFHPRRMSVERQNNCIALSYYACGPIAWAPVAIILGLIIAAFVAAPVRFKPVDVLRLVVTGMLLIEHLLWWRGLVHLSRHAVGRTTTGVVMVAILGPVLWLLTVGLIFVAVRFLIILPGLIYYSLQG